MEDLKRNTVRDMIQSIEANIENVPIAFSEDLSYRNRLFVINVCRGMSHTAAAIAAGWPEEIAQQTSVQLLKVPAVKNEIIRRTEAIAKASLVTKEYVLTELISLYEDEWAKSKPNKTLQVKILEHIGKVSGVYNPDLQINIQSPQEIKIQIVGNHPENS